MILARVTELRDPRRSAPENERTHIVRSLLGVHHLKVHQMARNAELIADAVAAPHVARHAGDVERDPQCFWLRMRRSCPQRRGAR
jgi:hypothetical protein